MAQLSQVWILFFSMFLLAFHTSKQMESLIAESTGQPQVGVKVTSLLSKYLEIPSCIRIDYMHSALEGVFKQLMRHWFDQKYHTQP